MLARGEPLLPCGVGAVGAATETFPTFQGLLQGSCKASQAEAVTVILAWILSSWEGQGRQVKVHNGQIISSHLDERRQSSRDRLRCHISCILYL